MKSILNVPVSCFENYKTANNPQDVNLLTWLTSAKYRDVVEQIRLLECKAERDKLKANLPAITPSGIFSHRREPCLLQHSGFIQFDIDLKQNQHIPNYDQLKQEISNISNVAYCGLSVSGTGFWGLVPIANPEKHRQHFVLLCDAFKKGGITLDTAPGNVASLRGYSFDDAAYFNHNAKTLEIFKTPDCPKVPFIKDGTSTENTRVEACIAEIIRRQLDLTGSYEVWFKIGCSLAAAFGEDARAYYHQISQFYPGYDSAKTDDQFNQCLKHPYSYNLGTFLYYCAQAGVTATTDNLKV